MKCKTILLTVLVSALVCAQATANITIPWETNQYGTYAVWTLTDEPTNFTNIAPDWYRNPTDVPSAGLFAEGDTPDNWHTGPRVVTPGTVYASPIMRVDLQVPNTIGPPDWDKIVQVELRYHTEVTKPGAGYMTSLVTPWGASAIGPEDVQEVTTGYWTDLTLQFSFPQAYRGESISIWVHDSGVTLDNIEVATMCVPVPGAVLLGFLGLGAAGLKLRRFA